MTLHHKSPASGYTPRYPASNPPSSTTAASIHSDLNYSKSHSKRSHDAAIQRPEAITGNGALRLDSTKNCRPQPRTQPLLRDMPGLANDSDSSDADDSPVTSTGYSSQRDSSFPISSQELGSATESACNATSPTGANNSDKTAQSPFEKYHTTRSGRTSRTPTKFADSQHDASQGRRQPAVVRRYLFTSNNSKRPSGNNSKPSQA
jgi:hypothetical protein